MSDIAHSVLHVRIGFGSFCPARRRMRTTSFVARLLSVAEIVASGYLAREDWEARRRFITEHWKLPVGAFIEECYGKRFGGAGKDQPRRSEPPSRAAQAGKDVVDPSQPVHDSSSQVSSLVCYLTNLATDPFVSSDIIKDSRASVVDLGITQVVDGDLIKVMRWYDNEWGYSSQLVREALRIARQIEVPAMKIS